MGRPNVAGLLREMSGPQLMAWMEFDAVDPIGGRRVDWNAAAIQSSLWNIATKGQKKTFVPRDFLLTYGGPDKDRPAAREQPRQTWQEQKFIAMMYAAAWDSSKDAPAPRGKRKR